MVVHTNTPTWIVCESDACPNISRRAGSDTKKKRGKTSLFFSRYPVRDFWHSSNCSRRCGRSWPRVSSPTQHWTTLGVSWALVMILIQDLSMPWNRLASCRGQRSTTAVVIPVQHLWQLFGDVSSNKHSLQIHPQVLNHHPVLNNVCCVG